MSRALVVQTAFIGDVVLTSPLLDVLAQNFSTVDVVCAPPGRDLLETHPSVRNAIVFDKRGKEKGLSGILRLAATLRALNYDIVYLAHRSFRSALLAYAARIPRRIGFANAPWRRFYTETRAPQGPHETDRYVSLAVQREEAPPLIPSSPHPSLQIPPPDIATARRYLANAGIDTTTPYVVLAPGSHWPTKRWPHYLQLARSLDPDIKLVSIGTDSDRGALQDAKNVVDLAGRLTIRESAAVINGARLVVANDSAPLHIAGALATPTLAIFGPTHPNLGFGPLGENDRVAQLGDLDCRPCSTHGGKKCPLGHHRCMTELGFETVAAEVRTMLALSMEDR